MKQFFFALTLLLLPGFAGAQAGIPRYELSSVAVDYPVNATANPTYSLQGTLGQTFATVDPPASTSPSLVYGGFGETYVPFAYVAQIALNNYVGNSNPGVTYGVMTNIPFTAETWSSGNVAAGVLSNATFFADGTGKARVLSSLNPAFAQSLSLKGPLWLRQNMALTFPADPVNGYPSASFHLQGGDANNDNTLDIADFGVLTNAYLGSVTMTGSSYAPNADFNQDGVVDISDFGLLVNGYGESGAP